MNAVPLWARKAIVDFIETGLAALFALNFVLPANIEEGKAVAALFLTAIAGAAIAAARRAIPGFLAWLNEKLGTGDE